MTYTRRSFLGTTAAVTATVAGAVTARAQDVCAVVSADKQQATTPAAALKALKDGNARFVAGGTINCDLRAQVKATASGQYPIAAIVGCIDSRVPPELVFDQRLGDVFAARIAGNFVNTDIIGSLEFATKVAGAKLIVVLGHTECGAIKGAVDNAKLGNLTKMLENFAPALAAATTVEGERNSKNKKLVQAVADQNVTIAAKQLMERSEVLRELVAAGQLQVVSAMHDVATGQVTFSV
jgi:carbonic anhydrase